MNVFAKPILILLIAATGAEAQTPTPVYWKLDHIQDASGRTVVVATPQPTDATAPSTPTDLQVQDLTETSVTLSWTGSTDSGTSGLAGYVIYRGAIPVGAVGYSATGFTDIGLVASSSYTYKVAAFDHAFNYSSLSSSANATTTASLTATAASTSQIDLSWTAPPSAPDHYRVWRLSGGSWGSIGTTSGTSYADAAVSASTGYFYKVTAENSSNAVLGWTNVDVAVAMTFTDDPLTVASTAIKAVHFTELRTAVNAIRAAAGLSAASWTDSTLDSSVAVKAVHVTELRTGLNEAMTAMGLASFNYTNATLTAIAIKKIHIDELRIHVK